MMVVMYIQVSYLTRLHGVDPTWEADSHSADQEIPHVLCNPKVHYRVHKTRPLVPILRQMTPAHTTCPIYFLFILLLVSSRLRLGIPSGLFPSGFPSKIPYAFLISSVSITWNFLLS
jgi:hypothetical protein